MMVLQKERDDFDDEVLNLKSMVLQLREEKEQLQQEEEIIVGSIGIQQIATDELPQKMSQVSLKDGEIKELKGKNSKLRQENRNLLKEKKDLEDKVSKQKEKLKGKF
jgi:FtsZ-binding cell division protein ZapB